VADEIQSDVKRNIDQSLFWNKQEYPHTDPDNWSLGRQQCQGNPKVNHWAGVIVHILSQIKK
jgi:hypothetical protein